MFNCKFILATILCLGIASASQAVSLPEGASKYRFEVTANPYRSGETIEVGLATPYLFKFFDHSRHHWGLFLSAGMNTFANVALPNKQTLEEELFNIEFIGGLFAQAEFYKDFIYQYGKVGFDAVLLSDEFEDSSKVGGLLESGLEFHADFEDALFDSFAVHVGLRWRLLFSPIEGASGEPDLLEGVSFVIGSRINF